MAWSDNARRAAQQARRAKGAKRRTTVAFNKLDKAVGKTGHKGPMHTMTPAQKKSVMPAYTHAKTRQDRYLKLSQPHKVLGSQGSPVGHKPAKPMKAPGVAKPTGQDAFTGKGKAMRPGGANRLKRVSDAGHRRTNAALNRKSHPTTLKMFGVGDRSHSDYVQSRINKHAKAVSKYRKKK
jgi:hypothetical protein